MEYSIQDIKVRKRYRKLLGDIDGLADSIERNGLMHAIVIDDSGNLLAGRRRLAAVTQLGWKMVPVTIMENPHE